MNSKKKSYDAIVIGVGGMGSATLFHLARRGKRVLGLERYNIPNDMGSSHGITRIIRLAYYEDPSYVPLLLRAYELWQELQQTAGEQLLHVTGSIDASSPGNQVFEGSRRSCEIFQLRHEVLSSAQLTQRFPGYRLPSDTLAVFQPEGGFLVPERCIVAHVVLAQAHDAEVHACEQVIDWEPVVDGVRVRTDRAVYEAGRLVVTAGAWVSKMIDEFAGLAKPERQVLGWFQPRWPELFLPERFPVFNLAVEEGRYYGLPVFGIPGFKLGRYHHMQELVSPDKMDRACHPRDESLLRTFAERYFPDAVGPTMSLKTCIFTNTPDEHFILDLHPQYPQVAIASPCSGHGFKFCSVVGEIMADFVERGETRHEISIHGLARFSTN
jgi:sarcosine oxidase